MPQKLAIHDVPRELPRRPAAANGISPGKRRTNGPICRKIGAELSEYLKAPVGQNESSDRPKNNLVQLSIETAFRRQRDR
jgi:hypothetical protein